MAALESEEGSDRRDDCDPVEVAVIGARGLWEERCKGVESDRKDGGKRILGRAGEKQVVASIVSCGVSMALFHYRIGLSKSVEDCSCGLFYTEEDSGSSGQMAPPPRRS